MGTTAPPSVVEAFGAGGTPGVDYTIIPIPSQVGVSPELASFTTAFPPATRTAKTQGGIPPRGLDMNGILFMISAHTAWLAAGGAYRFNQDVVDIVGGYNIGCTLQSAVVPTTYFINLVANNDNDPDVDTTGWLVFSPAGSAAGLQTSSPPAGPNNDYPLGLGVGFVDFVPSAGNITISGFAAGFDTQVITVTNKHATNSVTLLALNGASLAANQLRMAADITLLQYGSISFKYSAALALWVQI